MSQSPKKTSGWWYALGIVLMVVGPGGSCVAGLLISSNRVAGMPRAIMPGEHRVDLSPSDEVIYLEVGSVVDGKAYVGDPAAGIISCRMANAATGEPVSLRTPGSSVSFQFGGHAGRNLFEMAVPSAGTYVVACRHDDPSRTDPFVLAFGPGIGAAISVSLTLGFLLAILGLVMVIVVYTKRRRWNRAQAQPPAGQPPAPFVPPGT